MKEMITTVQRKARRKETNAFRDVLVNLRIAITGIDVNHPSWRKDFMTLDEMRDFAKIMKKVDKVLNRYPRSE